MLPMKLWKLYPDQYKSDYLIGSLNHKVNYQIRGKHVPLSPKRHSWKAMRTRAFGKVNEIDAI